MLLVDVNELVLLLPLHVLRYVLIDNIVQHDQVLVNIVVMDLQILYIHIVRVVFVLIAVHGCVLMVLLKKMVIVYVKLVHILMNQSENVNHVLSDIRKVVHEPLELNSVWLIVNEVLM